MYATLFATAIPRGPFRFQVTPVGTAHEVMDPLMIVHSVTDALFATKARTTTVATCTAAPLDSPKAVTDAESGPRLGCVAKLIVSYVVDAAEIESTVPLLRETVLPAAEGSKFCPLMTSVVEATSRLTELGVTIGAGGGPGGVGEGPGGPGGLGLLGTKTSPREEVSGIPVIGSTGSTVSGAAVTASLLF